MGLPSFEIHDIETGRGISFGALNKVNILEAKQAKTAGLALCLGYEAGLKDRTLDFFVNFIAQRFPSERDEGYIMDWAIRLLAGRAWSMADEESRGLLLGIARSMHLKNIPDEWSECT